METLWLPINGKFVEIALTVSEDTFKVSGKDHHIVEHDSSGFRYLATSDAIKKMRKESKQVTEIMNA